MKGRRLALDYGLARIGVAVSDPEGQFAFPISVLDAQNWEMDLVAIIREYEPIVIYVGYPINLSGDQSSSARLARDFAIELAGIFSGAIRLIDERFSTKSALGAMRSSGKSEKEGREEIDAAAAMILLEGALRAESNTSRFAGQEI